MDFSVVDSLQDGFLLTKLITKYCPVDGINISDSQVINKGSFVNILKTAEDRLGIPCKILSSSGILDGNTFDEYAVIIYMAVLRRKICTLKGEEPIKGGVKTEPSPSKQRNQLNGDSSFSYSPSKFPHNKTSLVDSSLSPTSLRTLVDHHTKSHAAIQALQERIQSVTHLASTPKLQKKLPESLFIKSMSPTPIEGISLTSSSEDVTTKEKDNFPVQVIPADQNDNVLEVNGEELFGSPLPESDRSTSDPLYTSVDKQFLELMLDAVQKGFMPPELATAKTWLNNDGVDVDSRATNGVNEEEHPLIDEKNSVKEMEMNGMDNEASPTATSVAPSLLSNGTASEIVGPTLANVEPMQVVDGPSLASEELTMTSDEVMHFEDNHSVPDTEESEVSTPNKKVQFLGLDTIFGQNSNSADESPNNSISPAHVQVKQPDTQMNDSDHSFDSSLKTTVTWATLDSPAKGTGNEKSQVYAISSPWDDLHRYERALFGKDSDNTAEGDCDDPFMMYLNSIEQTALKFKLQVEQAKVDTLEALKVKLEKAYEGTPLEDIPLKFREKLQETVAQIASDEVSKKYEALVTQDEEMSEEENQILECMRNELDSVACENFELHQQLALLKDYERKYFDLKEKFDSLDDGMSSIRNEYERKNGESVFLAERVESLEKNIVNLRVEYNNEITDLQNENLQLRKTCLELENRNKILEEEITAGDETSVVSRMEDNDRGNKRESFVADREYEMLQLRLEESERQNKALRAAAQADQAMIRCMEDKKNDFEKALIKAQDDHSNILLELHEAQRQISSDKVKLSSYQEETDALNRENKLLKSRLEIAQKELEYNREKQGEKSEPWKSNKRMIWREIRELEKILKDVHREKRTLEKKYVSFKHESDQLTSSMSLHSYSSTENTPDKDQVKETAGKLRSKSWHSRTEMEIERAAATDFSGDDDSFSSPPRKVKSWLEGLDSSKTGSKDDGQLILNSKEGTPLLTDRSQTNGTTSRSAADIGSPKKDENGLGNELEELRHHVGSLEAEKAAIVKELSSLRFSRITR